MEFVMPADQRRVKELFVAALELPDLPSRDAFLNRECAGDTGLVDQIRKLLLAHDAPHPAVDAPVAMAELTAAQQSATPGGIIDKKYKLLQHIGEGGMGSVWMADQFEPVKRRVALKLIHPDHGSSRIILARFEAERQAIALMDHPNIAKLLDAGTTDSGAPYFAMELVKGVRLTQYCDDHKLSVPERLILFQQICSAVQHAHQKGIIHRDLKPSNVLVESHDGKAVPKVIDFGLAKAITGQQLTEKTLFTAFGHVPGTPLYMSPEQAAFSALDVDTRADIYSLGVILYELVTGSTPIERARVKQVAMDEILRLVREDEPPLPSKRLSTTTAEPSIAVNRQLEPAKLGRFVKGELDWIVMKALAKERDRRYDSASSFAKDIERFLRNEPVLAGPPSASYRLRKFVRRNRPQVMAAAVVLLAVIVSAIGTTWGWIEARRQESIALSAAQHEAERAEGERLAKLDAIAAQQRAETGEKLASDRLMEVKTEKQRADDEQQIAQAVRIFLQSKLLRQADVWVQADDLARGGDWTTSADRNLTMRESLDRAALELTPEKIDSTLSKNPKVQAEILKTVGSTYLSLYEITPAVEFLQRAAKLCEKYYGPDDPATLSTLDRLARANELAGRLPQAVDIYERIRNAYVKTPQTDPELTRRSLSNLALAYVKLGKVGEAIPLFEQALESARNAKDSSASSAILNGLGSAYVEVGNPQAAIKCLDDARKINDKELSRNHPLALLTLRNLAAAYFDIADRSEAKRLMQQVRDGFEQGKLFGPDHPETLRTLSRIAMMYAEDDEDPQAIELLDRIREICERRAGPMLPDIIQILSSVGATYARLGRHKEAIALLEKARTFNDDQFGLNHPRSLSTSYSLADAYFRSGQLADAIPLFEKVKSIREKQFGYDRRSRSKVLRGLGMAYLSAGRLPQAERTLEEARDCLGKASDGDEIVLADALNGLAVAYSRSGKHAKSIELFEQARDLCEKKLGPGFPSTLAVMNNLALSYRGDGRLAEAIQMLRQVVAVTEKKLGSEHPKTLTALDNLGQSLGEDGRFSEAIAALKRAVDGRQKVLTPDHPHTLTSRNNLAVVYLKANRIDDAIPLLEKVRESCLKQFGPEGELTLTAKSNLAQAYLGKPDKVEDAFQLLEDVRAARDKQFGSDDQRTFAAELGLAIAYKDSRNWQKAIEVYERIRGPFETRFGPDHEETLRLMDGLGTCYWQIKNLKHAAAIEEDLLKRIESKFTRANHRTLAVLASVGVIYCDDGRQKQGMSLIEEAYQKGKSDPKLSWLTNLRAGKVLLANLSESRAQAAESAEWTLRLAETGSKLVALRQFADAEPVLRECLTLHDKFVKEPGTRVMAAWQIATVKSILGAALLGQRNYKDAQRFLLDGVEELGREKAIPSIAKSNYSDAIKRLILLYDATDKKDESSKWKKELDKLAASDQKQ
jgi:eukaryotic-like serine/threonine-protein kinase